METFSSLLAICAGNSPVTGEFHAHRPVTRSFDVFFDLRLNKQFHKQSWGWWFDTLSGSLWRHCNGCVVYWKIHSGNHWPFEYLGKGWPDYVIRMVADDITTPLHLQPSLSMCQLDCVMLYLHFLWTANVIYRNKKGVSKSSLGLFL